MKTKNRKCGVFAALTAVLLATAMLITSCSGPAENPGDEYTPPPGKGAIKLDVKDAAVRTILPGGSVNDFLSYEVTFDQTTGGTYNATLQILAANISNAIALDPGIYDITVVAYTDAAYTDAAAIWEGTSIAVTANISNNVSVTLEGYDPDGTAEGTFSYTITYGSTLTGVLNSATITITAIGGGNTVVVNKRNIIGAAGTGSQTLDSGYYYVDFILTHNDTRVSTFRQVLHVYQNLTSSFSYEFDLVGFVVVTNVKLIGIAFPDFDEVELTKADTTTLAEGGTITLSLGSTDTETITITGVDTAIAWYLDNTAITAGITGSDDEELTITAGTAPFTTAGTYRITVQGTKSGVPYSTYFFVEIEP